MELQQTLIYYCCWKPNFEQDLSVGYGTSSGSTVITRWRSDQVSANSTVASVNADGSAAFRSTIESGAVDRRGQFKGS